MTQEGNWDNKGFDKLMVDSKNELVDLQKQLQNLMVRFGLRALRVYQAARSEPLKPNEIVSLSKYELNNVIMDLTAQANIDNVIKLVREQWEKEQKR